MIRRRIGCSGWVNTARWDPDRVRDDLRAYMVEHLGHRDGVLIVDEAGFVKKGEKSVGCSGITRERRAGWRTANSASSWPTQHRRDRR